MHEDSSRFKVVVAHRRLGKTTMAINHLVRAALTPYCIGCNRNVVEGDAACRCEEPKISTAKRKYFYIAPSYRQAKEVAWDMLKHYAPTEAVAVNGTREAELTLIFQNGNRISLKGAENPDSLRGVSLHGAIFDEYAQQPSNIFGEIIRPALAENKGWAIWIGTPKGRDAFYRIYEAAKQRKDWTAFLFKASETGILDEDELVAMKQELSDAEYEQELECSFEAAILGSVYGNEIKEMREDNRITSVKYDPVLPVYTSWDFGVADKTAIGFYQVTRTGEIHMIDYIEDGDKPLDFYVREVKAKPYIYGAHFGDHAGKARDLSTGLSIIDILKRHGLRPFKTTRTQDKGFRNSLNAAKMALRKTFIDQGLIDYIDSLARYHYKWNERTQTFSDSPVHDDTSHAADQWRYFVINYQKTISRSSGDKVFIPHTSSAY